jgi:glutaminase
LNLNKTSPVTIELKDLNGISIKKVADMIFSEGDHEITFNCESLKTGIYFLQLKDNSGVEVKKIIVE